MASSRQRCVALEEENGSRFQCWRKADADLELTLNSVNVVLRVCDEHLERMSKDLSSRSALKTTWEM